MDKINCHNNDIFLYLDFSPPPPLPIWYADNLSLFFSFAFLVLLLVLMLMLGSYCTCKPGLNHEIIFQFLLFLSVYLYIIYYIILINIIIVSYVPLNLLFHYVYHDSLCSYQIIFGYLKKNKPFFLSLN